MGNPQEQRWLSIDGICTSLRLTKGQVSTLINTGCLVGLGKRGTPNYRILDPTPEYKEKLRLAAIIHQHAYPIPYQVTEKALLTAGEISQILGRNSHKTREWIRKHQFPAIRVNKTLKLYSVADVREGILGRKKRVIARQRAPFLLPEVIALLRRHVEAELEIVPTDAQIAQDTILQRKLERLAGMGEAAHADFIAKEKLARRILQILESTKEEGK